MANYVCMYVCIVDTGMEGNVSAFGIDLYSLVGILSISKIFLSAEIAKNSDVSVDVSVRIIVP